MIDFHHPDVEHVRNQKEHWLNKQASRRSRYGVTGRLAEKLSSIKGSTIDVREELELIKESANLSVTQYNTIYNAYLQTVQEGNTEAQAALEVQLINTAAIMQNQMERVMQASEKALRIEGMQGELFTKEDVYNIVTDMLTVLHEVAINNPDIVQRYEAVVEQRIPGMVQKTDVLPSDVNAEVRAMDNTVPMGPN